MKIRYRMQRKIDEVVLNKKVGIAIAVLSPFVFFGSAAYLSGYFGNIGLSVDMYKRATNQFSTAESSASAQVSVFESELKPIFTDAVRIYTSDNKISAEIESVEVDESGTLQTPKKWTTAGWYANGPRPGETGNMIINGHYDDSSARPAAFWQLKNLIPGDKVTVLDHYDREYTYIVRESLLVDINDPNRLDVLKDEENKPTMTLITCGGVWLPGKSTYNKRLVIKADLFE